MQYFTSYYSRSPIHGLLLLLPFIAVQQVGELISRVLSHYLRFINPTPSGLYRRRGREEMRDGEGRMRILREKCIIQRMRVMRS
jgi:hypothetical protein